VSFVRVLYTGGKFAVTSVQYLGTHTTILAAIFQAYLVSQCRGPPKVSLTKFLQLLNLAIFTTFDLLAVPAPHLLSLFLARQPSPL